MLGKIAIAASVTLLATTSCPAEDNKACILKATEALPRISGLVIKKTDPSRPGSDPGDVAGSDATYHRGRGYRHSGCGGNLFIHVCDDEGIRLRAPGDELAIDHPSGTDPDCSELQDPQN